MAFGYFFPASSNRLIAQANNSDLSKYIPKDVQKQIRDLTNTASSTINSSAVSQESKLTKAVEEIKHSAQEVKEAFEKTNVQEKIQEKFEESVSVAKETVEDVTERVAEIKKSVIEKVEEEKAKAEKSAEENDREKRLRKIREEDSLKRV